LYTRKTITFQCPTLAHKSSASQPTLTQMFGGGVRKKDPPESCDLACSAEKGPGEDREIIEVKDSDNDSCMEDGAESSESSVQELSEDESSSAELLFNRVQWRSGTVRSDSYALDSRMPGTFWDTILNAGAQQVKQEGSTFYCAFNRLFEDLQDEVSRDGMDHLLGLFGSSSPSETSNLVITTPESSKHSPPLGMSVLTQRGKSLAEEIHAEVASNASHLEDIKEVCPQWKENIVYAMHQKDPDDIRAALGNIQQSRARLETIKDSFMKAWHQQQKVLSLYEHAMNKSLGRIQARSSPLSSSEDIVVSQAAIGPAQESKTGCSPSSD
jgi:hypothetical protein